MTKDLMMPRKLANSREHVGTGLGELVSQREGARRLRAYARPVPLEAWAGPLANYQELNERFGISGRTLREWRSENLVIGLRAGRGEFMYPLGQFVEGRPVAGIAAVVAVTPSASAAWLWLSQKHPALDRLTPIEALKAGYLSKVLNLAGDNFGAY